MEISKEKLIELQNISILDENNELVNIHDLWKKRKALFIFVRHFG